MRSPESSTALLLTNRLVPLEVKPFTSREFWRKFAPNDDLAALMGSDVDGLTTKLLGDVDSAIRVRALLDGARAYFFELERLEEQGISTVSAFDVGFPPQLRPRLGEQCPVALLVTGPSQWLSEISIGIVGSRSAGEASADTAANLAKAG